MSRGKVAYVAKLPRRPINQLANDAGVTGLALQVDDGVHHDLLKGDLRSAPVRNVPASKGVGTLKVEH